jgi:hypothetical protein
MNLNRSRMDILSKKCCDNSGDRIGMFNAIQNINMDEEVYDEERSNHFFFLFLFFLLVVIKTQKVESKKEAFPFVSFDGKYFFFMSNRVSELNRTRIPDGPGNVYWMDALFIEEFRQK